MENYKIIGGDGVEYGPAPLDELQGWVRDGRVGKDTLVWRSDTSAWLPASRYTELEAELRKLYGVTEQPGSTSRPVGFGRRFVAYVLDQVVLGVVLSLLWPLANQVFNLPALPEGDLSNMEELIQNLEQWSGSVALFLLPLHGVYHILFNGAFGATPGKFMMGVRIVTLEGTRMGYSMAALRWLGQRLSDLLWGAGYLFIVFRPDKRALHDLIARTQVVFKQ